MAKEKVAKPAVESNGKINIQLLSAEYGVEAKDIRALLRANGFKAPEVTREPGTFGPKSKYEWDADSKELAKIRTLITKTMEADAAEADDAEPAVETKPVAKAKAKAKK